MVNTEDNRTILIKDQNQLLRISYIETYKNTELKEEIFWTLVSLMFTVAK
jgi:hypothetical protein